MQGVPCRASCKAAISPAGPAPTTSTGVSTEEAEFILGNKWTVESVQ
jgi:hypothetical protein